MSVTRFVVLELSLLVALLFVLACWFLVGLVNMDYISSFIEVSIGANAALLSTRVRLWLTKSLRGYSKKRIGRVRREFGPVFSDVTTKALHSQAKMVINRFEGRLKVLDHRTRILALVGIATGVLLLLRGVDTLHWSVRLVPVLILPVVEYYVASVACYWCMADHFSEVCGNFERSQPVATDEAIRGIIDKISKAAAQMSRKSA